MRHHGQRLVAVGLLGIAGYEIALRLLHPPLLARDGIHGSWLGFCIALELIGLFLMGRAKRNTA